MRSRRLLAVLPAIASIAALVAAAGPAVASAAPAAASQQTAGPQGTAVTLFPHDIQEIQAAIQQGDTARALEIVRSNPDVAMFHGPSGGTLLHYSASKGLDSLTAALIDAGADLEAKATMGPMNNVVPLAAATITKNISTMALLLDRGAKPNASVGNRQTPLLLAVSVTSVDGARVLLDHGAAVDLGDTYGTPLVHAAGRGDSAMVILLLERGADINSGSAASEQPIGSAAMEGRAGVVRLLLSRGADLEATRAYFDSPASSAAREHPEVATLLKRAWVFGRAAEKGTLAIVRSMSSHEPCFVNERIGGFTPLGLAVRGHHPDVVEALLAAGADPNLTSDVSKTALDLAGDDVAIKNLIINAGGRPGVAEGWRKQ